MNAVRRSAAVTCEAALLAGGVAVAAAPAASAQVWHEHPAFDVLLPNPTGGQHTIRYHVVPSCKLGDDGHFHQAVAAGARDLDHHVGSFDFLSAMYPFNSATVSWHNIDTDQRGSQTVQSTGPEVGTQSTITGQGRIAVTVSTSKSLFPTLAPGSVAPFGSTTHTEHFLVAPRVC